MVLTSHVSQGDHLSESFSPLSSSPSLSRLGWPVSYQTLSPQPHVHTEDWPLTLSAAVGRVGLGEGSSGVLLGLNSVEVPSPAQS